MPTLAEACAAVEANHELLHEPAYAPLAALIKTFGGRLPAKKAAAAKAPQKQDHGELSDDDRDDEAMYWRIPLTESAADAPGFTDPRVGAKAEPTEADDEQAMDLKAQAAEKAADGNFAEAVALISQALALTPKKAMYWALRAEYFFKQKLALAALHDANVALELNGENARALRVRGRVYRHLHKWEDAAHDLNAAQRVDFDENVDAMLKFVQPRSNARRDRRRHRELEAQEAAHQERIARQEELRKQREREQAEAAAEAAAAQGGRGAGGMPGGMGGGMPGGMGGMPGGMGGMPGGMGGMPGMGGGGIPPQMAELFQDPEIMAAMQDPDTAAKLSALMSNPMAAMQMMGDPKMGPLIQKIMGKMMGGGMGGMPGGMGGMPGGMGGMPGMGGMGGMGGMPSGAKPAASKPADDLD